MLRVLHRRPRFEGARIIKLLFFFSLRLWFFLCSFSCRSVCNGTVRPRSVCATPQQMRVTQTWYFIMCVCVCVWRALFLNGNNNQQISGSSLRLARVSGVFHWATFRLLLSLLLSATIHMRLLFVGFSYTSLLCQREAFFPLANEAMRVNLNGKLFRRLPFIIAILSENVNDCHSPNPCRNNGWNI